MTEVVISFQVDEDLKSEFAAAAEAMERSGEDLLRDYMREVIQEHRDAADYDAWFRRQVQKGLDDVEAGNVLSHEEAEAEFAMMRAELRRGGDAAE